MLDWLSQSRVTGVHERRKDDMTWKQFKEYVDKELKEKGIEENTELWYIDISFLGDDDIEKERINVFTDKDCGVAIDK
jgi:Tfp pilus assembly pilus retraction ATPase PilT